MAPMLDETHLFELICNEYSWSEGDEKLEYENREDTGEKGERKWLVEMLHEAREKEEQEIIDDKISLPRKPEDQLENYSKKTGESRNTNFAGWVYCKLLSFLKTVPTSLLIILFSISLMTIEGFIAQPIFRKSITSLPPLQMDSTPYSYPIIENGTLDTSRASWIREAALHAWNGYRNYAWGYDTLCPISKQGVNDFGGIATTMVDSLDTLYIMGFDFEFKNACTWIKTNLRFDKQEDINLFETTIRVLGGLLSAYHLSGDTDLKALAIDLGEGLLPAFHTRTGLPFGTIGLLSGSRYNPDWSNGFGSISEVATLSLEFRFLAHISKSNEFRLAVDHVTKWLSEQIKTNNAVHQGLFPMFVNPITGDFGRSVITLGARVDSIYEYFLKGWVQTNHTEPWILNMYMTSLRGIVKNLLRITDGPENFVYITEIDYKGNDVPKMDHLVCYVPGMLALGLEHKTSRSDSDKAFILLLAKHLMRTCYHLYLKMETGIAPEIAQFHSSQGELSAKPGAKHALLRPETVESLFILYRVTKDPIYKEWGWNIFKQFEKFAKVSGGGYSGLNDVTKRSSDCIDRMESFFLSETLKYLYLLFMPSDLFPLDKYVFTTEAHILPIFEWD